MYRVLYPISWLYGIAVATRNAAFEAGLLRRERVPAPVVSVGNLTAGGTGKTPLVEYLLGELIARGESVAVVSLGYGRRSRGVVIVSDNGRVLADAREGGDEPVQIARKFPRASVVVGERRVEAARTAIERCGAHVIVMDDGFQHRYLERDLSIVVIDSRIPLNDEPLLPAGVRREQLSALRRADLLAFSRAEGPGEPAWRARLDRYTDAESISFRSVIRSFEALPERTPLDHSSLKGLRLYAFSGIGDHTAFLSDLHSAGLLVVGERRFADHHLYRAGEIDELLEASSSVRAEALVTTEKDAVRMAAGPDTIARLRERIPLICAVASIAVLRGESTLGAALSRALEKGRPS
ncbi:MAG TPA: tetraacyldisaccharide 4'-kinase [Bacteroidota bacterium]|nr:tetraacyldisaccharide 4'-kinase [Bacteroidota bacterium]